MTSDADDDQVGPLDPPGPLDAWLDEQADAMELSREEVVVRLLEAHQSMGTDHVASTLDDRIDTRVDAEIASVRSSLEDDVAELRERVETLENALAEDDADDELRERVAALESAMETAAGDDHEHAAFERLEAIDRLEERLDDLAMDDLAHITGRAMEEGIVSAPCGACRETIDLRLLATPACPHCGSALGGLHPGDGFFDEPRLTGEPLEETTD